MTRFGNLTQNNPKCAANYNFLTTIIHVYHVFFLVIEFHRTKLVQSYEERTKILSGIWRVELRNRMLFDLFVRSIDQLIDRAIEQFEANERK